MIPSFNIQPGESSAAVAQRRRIAELLLKQGTDTSPIRHWTQGAARMAQAMMGGYELSRADKIEKEKEAKRDAGFLNAVGISANPVTPPAAAPAVAPPAVPSGVPMASTSGKIYSNDEPSPLDPPGGADRDMAVRTVIAEAGNQPQVGREAVARVLMNRAVSGQFGGDTLPGVIQKPNQFEPWNTAQGRARMAAINPNSPAYMQAGEAVDKAYSGAPDPTKGATHFYAPKAQAALGRRPPSWDNGTGVDIADHRFFGGAGTPPVLAGASPTDLSASRAGAGSYVSGPDGNLIQVPPGADPAAVRAGAGQPQAAAPAPMQVAQAAPQQASRNTPQIPQAVQDRIRILVQSGNRDLALAEYQKYTAPSQATFGVIGETADGQKQYGWIDPLKQTTTPQQGAGQPGAAGTVIGPDGRPVEVPEGQRKPVQEAFAKARAQNALPASWDDTAKLRGEVRQLPSYKNLSEAAPIYKTMLDSAGRNTKASDLNLVYGLGKIFDPGSVVREGEMVMVKNTAGIPDWLAGTINALNGGAALTPETRQAIMREAHSRIQSYQQMFEQDATQYRGVAERNRMNVDDVLPNFGEFTPWAPVGQPGAPDVPIPQARPQMLNQPAPVGAVAPQGNVFTSRSGKQFVLPQ